MISFECMLPWEPLEADAMPADPLRAELRYLWLLVLELDLSSRWGTRLLLCPDRI